MHAVEHGNKDSQARSGFFATVDSTGGKLFYRTISILFMIMAALSTYAAWSAFGSEEGSVFASVLMLVIAVGCCWGARWCWSPDRLLSELD